MNPEIPPEDTYTCVGRGTLKSVVNDIILHKVGLGRDVVIVGCTFMIDSLLDELFYDSAFIPEDEEAAVALGIMGRYKLALVQKVYEDGLWANQLQVIRGERTCLITDSSVAP